MLTDHERDVLAHVLVYETPEEWEARVYKEFGPEIGLYYLALKVNRHRDHFMTAVKKSGYKTARKRHDDDHAALAQHRQQFTAQRESEQQAEADEFQRKVDAAVEAALQRMQR
jgi:hypothetical protein